ncbi:homoserine O-acetyltransferase [Oceanobacillus limi]|uniref:Homoserine O-acetyltransferase n=1 Tax=Oceanobacillus limi TaxID=930131 RepID=A0A1I0F211_9BACI|nr:homoserine O-acetyltransferase [Oceanobacillus limi]SET51916.1 homoserine O-acetyltransferase [Oceanobacillus limi]
MAYLQSEIPYQTGEVSIGPLSLSSGETLENVTLTYELVGVSGKPIILVCHALTGNHITVGNEITAGWWDGLIGHDRAISTMHYQVLTFNVLGGCNGSTGPTSLDPKTGTSYRTTFPKITVRDMVQAQYLALEKLHIKSLHAIIGGSLGGMQVLEWGLLFPTFMNKLISLASTPRFSDYGIAFNHIAEATIRNDPNWQNGRYFANQQIHGLEIARMVGMVTYRSAALFTERFDRKHSNDCYAVSSYLNYQGKKLANRFDANSYIYLLQAMNNHDIGRNRGGWKKACQLYRRPLLAIGYANDLIYEPKHIQQFAEIAPNCTYHYVETIFGHDGFLTEYQKWENYIADFI